VNMDPFGVAFVVFLVALLVAGALGFGVDSRDGVDGSNGTGRRRHHSWTWW
jgi:hypothetical protein